MIDKRWALIALGGWLIATAAIVGDWELRASLAYLGGTIFGWGMGNAYPLTRKGTQP